MRSHSFVFFGTDFIGGSSPSFASASGSGTCSYSVFSVHSSTGNEMNSEYFRSISRSVKSSAYLSASSLSVRISRVPDPSIGSESSAEIVYLSAAFDSHRSCSPPSIDLVTTDTVSATRNAE